MNMEHCQLIIYSKFIEQITSNERFPITLKSFINNPSSTSKQCSL